MLRLRLHVAIELNEKGINMETLTVNQTEKEERISKPNLFVLILLLFLAQLSVGYSGRLGPFIEFGGGMGGSLCQSGMDELD